MNNSPEFVSWHQGGKPEPKPVTPARVRGFEPVVYAHRLNPAPVRLPTRATQASAGYDLYMPVDLELDHGDMVTVFTDVKSYMPENEVLMIFPRSSLGKKGLVMQNTVGIVDSDYYSNPDNDGNIGLLLKNINLNTIRISAGDRIAQAIFLPYGKADSDTGLLPARTGGTGSTGN